MKLLLIRHALAVDREEFARTGADDGERPLTGKGRRRMQAIARGLGGFLDSPEPRAILTSPLVRAVQTAAIVQRELGGPEPEESDALAPDAGPAALLAALRALDPDAGALVVAVGHEPHLSTAASWFLTGRDRPLLDVKKGSALLLDLGDDPEPGAAVLLWALPPRALRQMEPRRK
jgi:phosphohistidine phosphatase